MNGMMSFIRGGAPRLMAAAALAFLAFGAATACAEKSGIQQPSWMEIDAEAKKVTIDMVAGWSGQNGALNFNGYHNGNATVVIPVGWDVLVNFTNNDGNLPHSLLVTKPYTQENMPQVAGHSEVAIPRAYTRDPINGISGGQSDYFTFTAKEAGKYFLFCGVTGHGLSGMWIHLELRTDAELPGVIVGKGAKGRD